MVGDQCLMVLEKILSHAKNYLDLHNMPDNMDINNIAKKFNNNNSNIEKLVYEAIENKKSGDDYKAMLNNCFYFNDGSSTDRAIEFLSSL